MSVETGERPFVAGPNWIEIDHATDAVSFDPEVDPRVYEYFEHAVDPQEEWSQWLIPKEGIRVEFVGTDPRWDWTSTFLMRYHFVTPEGQAKYLIYRDVGADEDAPRDVAGQHRVVEIVDADFS